MMRVFPASEVFTRLQARCLQHKSKTKTNPTCQFLFSMNEQAVSPQVRLEVANPPEDSTIRNMPDSSEYKRLYRKAALIKQQGGFKDIKECGAVRRAGPDKAGRPCFVFMPSLLPQGIDIERVVMYGVTLMHAHIVQKNKPYTAVWVCNNIETSQLGYFWFRRTYKMVPTAYRDNLSNVVIIHPGVAVRATLFMLSCVPLHAPRPTPHTPRPTLG